MAKKDESLKKEYLNKAGDLGKSAMKEIEYLTMKNKLVAGITHNTKNLFNKVMKSDDPLKELGPGISSYHQLLLMLWTFFLLLAVLHLPVLLEYTSYEFYDEDQGWIAGSSIGNMGFSQTQCQTASMVTGNTHTLKCSSG
jgi:hypothetical protein